MQQHFVFVNRLGKDGIEASLLQFPVFFGNNKRRLGNYR